MINTDVLDPDEEYEDGTVDDAATDLYEEYEGGS